MRKLRNPSVILLIIAILLAGFSVYHTNFAKNTDGPEISFDEKELTATTSVSDEELLKGVTAKDNQDGDVTDSLVVEGLSTFMDDNIRLATYAAFDSDGNVTKATRKVKYKNYVGPQFSLSEPLSFPVGTSKDLQSNISAFDQIDGDISGSILMYPDTNLDTSIPGDYKVRFEVANSAGDVEDLNMTIKIYDTDSTAPVQVGLTEYIAYINLGQSSGSDSSSDDGDSSEDSDNSSSSDSSSSGSSSTSGSSSSGSSSSGDSSSSGSSGSSEDSDSSDSSDNGGSDSSESSGGAAAAVQKAANTITGRDDLIHFIDTVTVGSRKTEVIGTGNESETAKAAAEAAGRRSSSGIIRADDIDIDDSGVNYSKAGVYTVTYSYTSDGLTGKAQLTLIVRDTK